MCCGDNTRIGWKSYGKKPERQHESPESGNPGRQPIAQPANQAKKGDEKPYTITRMKWGKRWQLFQTLKELGFRGTIQTVFIERINLTIRQRIAPPSRRTWSLARSQPGLLIHVHWWRGFYHFARPHQSLRAKVPGLERRYRERTPAMAAGLTDHVWTVGDILSLPLVFEGGVC
jgi:hypothetical protein